MPSFPDQQRTGRQLQRWRDAGLIDAETAERIEAWEQQRAETTENPEDDIGDESSSVRWPLLLALTFGGILVAAGLVLFISARWHQLSPVERLLLMTALVVLFHGGGIWSRRDYPGLATTLHAIGTVAFVAGVIFVGEAYHLTAYWTRLWLVATLGCWVGLLALRDIPHTVFVALLTPFWIQVEWLEMPVLQGRPVHSWAEAICAGFSTFCALWCVGWLFPGQKDGASMTARTLRVVGVAALIPMAMALALATQNLPSSAEESGAVGRAIISAGQWVALAIGALGALGIAAVLGLWQRGRGAWIYGVACVWIAGVIWLGSLQLRELCYLWLGLGAVATCAWGVMEGRTDRVNLGIVGFALTVIFFYFSSLMDRLGRSLSLVMLGLLFLLGGYLLERVRRRLVREVLASRESNELA